MVPFSITLNDHKQDFKVTPLFEFCLNISETVRDTNIVTMELRDLQTPYSRVLFRVTLTDLEWQQNIQWLEASRGLSATPELLVLAVGLLRRVYCVTWTLRYSAHPAWQEAQLSQRGRATARWKFCLVNQGHSGSFENGMCKFLLVFHCNHVSTLYRFWDIQRRIIACPWNLSTGSFKVAPFDWLIESHKSSNWRSMVNCLVSIDGQYCSAESGRHIVHGEA